MIAAALAPAFASLLRPIHGSVRAQAAVPASITLHTSNGGVVIATSPFRYAITDATGRSVLVAAPPSSSAAPESYVITSELPDAPASTQVSAPVYSPFVYTVGTARTTGQPAGPFEGDLVGADLAGISYEATTVLSQTHTATSASLVIATNETPERHVELTIAADTGGFRFTATFDHGDDVAGTSVAFVSPTGEAFHGFGGRHNALDQHGLAVTNYVEQEDQNPANVPGAPAATSTNYLFPNGPAAAYDVLPQFLSSSGYGFYLRRPELSEFRLDADGANEWLLELFGATMDYTVSIGSYASVIADQTSIGGRQIEPPEWALESEIDRAYANGETSGSDYYTKVQSDLAEIATKKIPVTTYRLEGWSTITAAQVSATIASLRKLGIHTLLYINPYGAYSITPITLQETLAGGYEAKTPGGAPYLITGGIDTPSAVLDLTNPATVKFFTGVLDSMLDTGADGYMEDFGEQVLPDMQFANGQNGLVLHNAYPTLYHEVSRVASDAYLKSHPGKQFFSYTRSGYAGSPRYEYANFPGDETSDFGPASGLSSLAPDMLNRSVGGAYGYTTDIGGYFDYTGSPSKELFLRWAAWSALTPFFRLHNGGIDGTEMPWDIDADTVTKYAALATLHDRFVPMIARLWREADATGLPIVRPLWLADPGDAYGATISQEWLLGPDVLVAPVVVQGATTNAVYLPAGCWQDQNTLRTYQGRRTVTVAAPVGSLPYFFRCGTHPA